jgi:hypothetical protein
MTNMNDGDFDSKEDDREEDIESSVDDDGAADKGTQDGEEDRSSDLAAKSLPATPSDDTSTPARPAAPPHYSFYPPPYAFHPHYPQVPPLFDTSGVPDPIPDSRRNRGGVTEPFPEKLHRMLDICERDSLSDVVSFFAHGRASSN